VLSAQRSVHVRDSHRRGLTLLELLISLVLVGLMGGLIIGFLLKQERFYAGANEILQTRTQVRQASVMLPSDLRAISSPSGDIYAMTDTSIEFRSTFGSSYLCSSDKVNSKIIFPPLKLAKGSQFTSWTTMPAVNDSLALYDDGATTSANDDNWLLYKITAITLVVSNAAPGCLSATGMMKSTDVGGLNPSYNFTITPTQSATVSTGAAVRFFKRVHYSLYRAADGQWYLGYYDCRTSRVPVCNTIAPIAGPLRPYIAGQPQQAGLRFTYYDNTGTVTANKLAVSRISILLQGEGAKTIQLAGGSPVTFRDSLRIEVGLRNWR
jgi:prepilin-type N-terminal cleavage/methylation domain-containing protein